LGNVTAVVTGRLLNGNGPSPWQPELLSAQGYEPFGSLLPGRNYSSDSYRFGFNGQEKVDEVNGSAGTHNTALFWEYDTRIGRRWNLDPKPNPSVSQYACFANNPIWFIDVLGDTTKVGNWIRQNLPGLIAAPLAGLVDGAEGLGRATGRLFSGDKAGARKGLADAGAGGLSMVGLADFFTGKPKDTGGLPTQGNLPPTLSKELVDIQTKVWDEHPDAATNGMHAWHAGTNAALANKLGPFGSIGVFLGGLWHESPLDAVSFRGEQNAQGTVNHIADSFMDIVANGFGIGVGLLLPRRWAINVSVRVGNQIPGPGDPDPTGHGGGLYRDNPHPSVNWGATPQW